MAVTLCSAQEVPWTPTESTGLTSVRITTPDKYRFTGLDAEEFRLSVPEGWTVTVYAAGLSFAKPRFMAWGPDSVLYVANMNRSNILALPDKNRDGVADTIVVAASGFSFGNDVRFYRDTMFVAQEAGLVKLWRSDPSSTTFDQRAVVINKAQQPNQTGGNHRTRTVVLDTNTRRIYFSVGSRSNAARESTVGAERGTIEEYSWDGTGRRVYAHGVRNAVGMTLHPRTGRLWANNNGSDNQGNDVPPEWVDIVRDQGFYGYPVAYHIGNWMNFSIGGYGNLLPLTAQDSQNVASMVPPAALVAAHCAPMAIEFVDGECQRRFGTGLLMVMRGSWNRSPASGAKVVFLEFDNDEDTIANVVRDVVTGFIRDSTNTETRWARPVGLVTAADGSFYLSLDDGKPCILKFTPPPTTSSPQQHQRGSLLRRSSHGVEVNAILPAIVTIYDMMGRLVFQSATDERGRLFVSRLTHTQHGPYAVVVTTSQTSTTELMMFGSAIE